MYDLNSVLSWGLLGVFALSFALYTVPFVGPSTLAFAGAIAAIMPQYHPALIGAIVAFACALAKVVDYYLTYFTMKAIGVKSIDRLRKFDQSVGRWKPLAIFLASIGPLPNEPIIAWLALTRYNPVIFFLSFLAGKLVVTISGAYIGRIIVLVLTDLIGFIPAVAASVAFAVVATVILLKRHVGKMSRKSAENS